MIPGIRIGISVAIGSDQTGTQSGPPEEQTDPGAGGGGGKDGGK